MAVPALAGAAGYIIAKVADNNTSVASALNGGYVCSQGHNHRTDESRSDCETITREKQKQDFELKMKQTELDASKNRNMTPTEVSSCMDTASQSGRRSIENVDSGFGNKLCPDPSDTSVGYGNYSSREGRRDYRNPSDKSSRHSSTPASSDSRSDFSKHRRGRDKNKHQEHRHDGGQYSRSFNKEFQSDFSSGFKLKVRKQRTVRLKWGGEDSIFRVTDSVLVHIYTGRIDKVLNVKAVVCSTDMHFGTTGYISRALGDAFGEKYQNNYSKMKAKENHNATLGHVYTCETGAVNPPYVMHLAMKSLLCGNEEELKYYRKGLFNLFSKAEKRQFGEIAVPLLGTGKVQSKSAVLKSCCSCVLEALKDFCNQRSSKYLMDIHLVNNSEEVTQLMVDTFKEAERCSSKPDRHDL